jgi:hypothetical protein
MRELLSMRAAETSERVTSALTQYLDPQSGVLPQRLQALVREDGELERLLRTHVGGTTRSSLVRWRRTWATGAPSSSSCRLPTRPACVHSSPRQSRMPWRSNANTFFASFRSTTKTRRCRASCPNSLWMTRSPPSAGFRRCSRRRASRSART